MVTENSIESNVALCTDRKLRPKVRSCVLTYGINVGHVEILYVLAKHLQKN